ncbi:MAG TPA: OsmC family protein [Planctomycetota bacterium]|nr:OsmC family protein [Planctomycetota bacterium]
MSANDPSSRDSTRPDSAADPREVVVRGSASGFRQDVTLGRHRLVADEPTAVGGGDAGPDPYGLLLAALGACTSMTLGMYARRKGWPLESVRVRLRHAKEHAADCADCASRGGMLDRIRVGIELVGPLDEGQRARLLEIAQRCPVHRTLTGAVAIDAQLVGSAGADEGEVGA